MAESICVECGLPGADSKAFGDHLMHFGCKLKSIRLGFSYGKEDFHGPTIRERQAKQVSDAKINGYNIEPVGSRWV